MDQEQRERIRAAARHLYSPDVAPSDDDLDWIERHAPATWYLIERRAAGSLEDGPDVTSLFLRMAPEIIFDHLLGQALDCFAGNVAVSELRIIAALLLMAEQGRDPSLPPDVELPEIVGRLALLIHLEQRRRAGKYQWVDRYTLLAPVTELQPLRIPATEKEVKGWH
jgi:hypothetical protein